MTNFIWQILLLIWLLYKVNELALHKHEKYQNGMWLQQLILHHRMEYAQISAEDVSTLQFHWAIHCCFEVIPHTYPYMKDQAFCKFQRNKHLFYYLGNHNFYICAFVVLIS